MTEKDACKTKSTNALLVVFVKRRLRHAVSSALSVNKRAPMRPQTTDTTNSADRKRLRIALLANLAMFVTGLLGWYLADSTSLLADAFDMLADASGYIVAMLAIGRTALFQRNAARWNGGMLILLGAGVFGEVIHRYFVGSEPQGILIIGFSVLSLLVNGSVLRMLSCYQNSPEIHLRATWVDTRADVVVNLGVLVSGLAITYFRYQSIDLVAGLVIGAYVIKEGLEIWEEASETGGCQ
jgi:Co/Zn/Cd efflux system component